MFEKGKKENMPTRIISDHGLFRQSTDDPNGYVVELTQRMTIMMNIFSQHSTKQLSDWTEQFHAEDSLG